MAAAHAGPWLAAGVVLGGFVVWWGMHATDDVRPDGADPGARSGDPRGASPAAAPVRAPADAVTVPEGTARPGDRSIPARTEGAELVSAQLLAYAAAEIGRGWREVRSDDVPALVLQQQLESFADQVRALPAVLGHRAAEEHSLREAKTGAFATADGVELLKVVDGNESEAPAFVRSERFAALFAPQGGGSGVDGTTLAHDAKVPDGSVVSFPAGVFAVHDLARSNDPFPSDLTVRGAGMDATLLVLDAQRSRAPMRRFALEDCTVFADNAITDLRSVPGVLALRRVRVIGFDCGAGGSVAFYLGGGCAMLARDSRFEGGYGRHPQGYANLMSSSGACLARFERCWFDRMSLNDATGRAIAFVDCTMHELLDEAPRGPIVNCRITFIPQEKKWDADYRRRDLDALFPQWKQRLERR